MVYVNNEDNNDVEVETTSGEDGFVEETELVDDEARAKDKIKQFREKLARCEDEKRDILEESQRAKADFLNARKRLEEERVRDRVRAKKQHVEELLPLCDSFEMAMKDKEAWERADAAWRKGVEGIHNQLQRLLESYQVTVIDPVGEPFDPYRDEAVGTEEVDDKQKIDTVVSVVQSGYEMQVDGTAEVIRHARVTTGVLKE
jgi:molecular chaperone GrpE